MYLAAFSRRLASTWSSNTASTTTGGWSSSCDLQPVFGQASAGPRDAWLDEVVEVVDLEIDAERPGLDPAQVEQVRDDPVQVLGLAVDHLRGGAPVVRASGRPCHR